MNQNIQEIMSLAGFLTLFAGIVGSYVSLRTKFSDHERRDIECRKCVEAHMSNADIHMNQRSWEQLSERLDRIERKLDMLSVKV
jgi:hypothetical protein